MQNDNPLRRIMGLKYEEGIVWRGSVRKILDPDAKPEKLQKNLNKAVKKLLKNYFPEAKK